MISPEDHERAISSVRFLVGAARPVGVLDQERQYTFVELYVKDRTSKSIEMTFYLPPLASLGMCIGEADARDESALVSALGGSPVNDALDSWDLKNDPNEHRNRVQVATFERLAEGSKSREVSGCDRIVRIVVPPGPCIVNAGWSHAADPKALFVPTQNETMSEWRMDAVVIGGFADTSGKPAVRPLARSFRFDLAFAHGVIFGNLDDSILVSRWSPALPFHNLYVPRQRADPSDREYRGVSGVHFVDGTSRRLVAFYDVMFMTIPVVCGCFIRHSTSFPDAHVPLAVPERATRTHPIVFSDGPGDSILMSVAGVNCFSIDPTKRDLFKGVTWVSMAPLPP